MKAAFLSIVFVLSTSYVHASSPVVIEPKSMTCAQAVALLNQHGQLTIKYKNIFGFTSTASITIDPQCPFTTIAEVAIFRTQDQKHCRLGFYTACQPDPVYQGGGN